MKRTIIGLTIVGLAAGSVAAPSAIGAKGKAQTKTFATGQMSGNQEAPTKGDPDGSGSFTVTTSSTQVCIKGSVKKVAGVNGLHIHKGAKGKAGPVVVDFSTKLADVRRGRRVCTTTGEGTAIAKAPSAFYLNAHNMQYPGGAVRGQLRKP